MIDKNKNAALDHKCNLLQDLVFCNDGNTLLSPVQKQQSCRQKNIKSVS